MTVPPEAVKDATVAQSGVRVSWNPIAVRQQVKTATVLPYPNEQ